MRGWENSIAEGLKDLREASKPDPECQGAYQQARLPVPAPAVLEVCQPTFTFYEEDPPVDDWARLAGFAFAVCDTVDKPPFESDFSKESTEINQKYLRKFEKWFAKNRKQLERLAAKEAEPLEQARQKLASVTSLEGKMT